MLCYKYIISCNYYFLWSFLYMTFDSTHTHHAAHMRRAIYSTCSSRFNHLFYVILLIARVVFTTSRLHSNVVYCYFHCIVVRFVDSLSLCYLLIVICSSLLNFTQTRSKPIHNNNYTHNNVTQLYNFHIYMMLLRSSHFNCLFICLLQSGRFQLDIYFKIQIKFSLYGIQTSGDEELTLSAQLTLNTRQTQALFSKCVTRGEVEDQTEEQERA